MKPEIIAALTALAHLDAARLQAWATHHSGLQTHVAGLHFDPDARSPHETALRSLVDAELNGVQSELATERALFRDECRKTEDLQRKLAEATGRIHSLELARKS
jgi:hypothetical protein